MSEAKWRNLSFYLKNDSIWEKRKSVLKFDGPDKFEAYITHLKSLNNPLLYKDFVDKVVGFAKLVDETRLQSLIQDQPEPLQFVFVSIANLLNTEIQNSYKNVFSKQCQEICSGLSDDIFSKLLNIILPALRVEYKVYLEAYDYPDHRESLLRFVSEASISIEWIQYFFEQYPVAVARIENLIGNYIEYIIEFFTNLKNDENALRSKFYIPDDSEIVKINTGLGDLHNSSRSTIKIQFNQGPTIYYKPRDLKSEVRFYDIYEQLLKLGLRRSIVKTSSLVRDSYAWQLGIEPMGIHMKTEASAFYYNQGITTAIAYIFNIQDLISDNIIAVGEGAGLIDLEIFMHPAYPTGLTYKTNSIAGTNLLHSVIKTGLIPQFGFESVNNPGQSNAGISMFKTAGGYDSNLPTFDNEIIPIDHHCVSFEEGFIYAYNFFKEHKDEVYEILSVEEAFEEQFKVRTIIRYTYKYSILSEKLNSPEILQDYVVYGNVVEFLWRGYNKSLLPEQIIQSEIEQIFQDDVPLFYTLSNSRDLFNVKGELLISDYFSKSGIELAKDKLSKLSERDLNEQVNIIRRSLIIHNEYDSRPLLKYPEVEMSLIDQIRETLSHLKGGRESGHFSYIDYTITKDSLWSQDIQESDIFQGIPGLGIFFIASYATFKKETDLSNATIIFDQTIEYLKKTQIDVSDNPLPSLGIVNYPISILYMSYLYNEIYSVGGFALDDDLLNFLLDFINANIKKDTKKDYLFGSVGTGLLLLRMYDKKPNLYVYSTIKALADNLVSSKLVIDKERITWESSSHDKWGGFAHGTASSAYFLFQAHQLTNNESYYDDAIKALNYDQSLFDINLKLWKKTLEIVGDRHHGWSNGDAGIGLGRFLCRKYYTNAFLEQELSIVKNSIENVLGSYLEHDHSICSGFFGSIELYSLLFEESDKPKIWIEDFDRKITSIKDLKSGGWYQNQEITGLYYGLAGIGYNYLKMKFNSKLPSLLFL